MDEIYNLLAKHFLKETNEKEEKTIAEFKEANEKEYESLEKLWNSEGIQVYDFDSAKAWKVLSDKIELAHNNKIPLYYSIRNIAAAIAVIIISTLAVIYIYNGFDFSDKILIENPHSNSKQINLDDGSTVWLSRNSSISFPRNFTDNTRDVALIGKAYFEVKKEMDIPFRVTTRNSIIAVLGTAFNINTSLTKTEISVRSGTVQVLSSSGDQTLILKANQSATVTQTEILKYDSPDRNYLSWMTGIFEFEDTPVNQVVEDLNTFYNGKISLDSTKNYTCNLTAQFNSSSIEDVVEILKTTCDLEISKLDNKYFLR